MAGTTAAREEFVVVGWTDPEGSQQHIGALLLGYYTDDGRLALRRQGGHWHERELKRLAGVLAPLQVPKMLRPLRPRAITVSGLRLSSQRFTGCGRT
jgi:ATP-dependent DNA ligase